MEILALLSQLLLLALGIFLMIVILLQRGRGGGLAGAFGGLGGQSAFGTKAGDVFTKITIVMAVMWVLVAGSSGLLLRAVGEGMRAQELPEVDQETPGMSGAEGEEEPANEAAAPLDVETVPGEEAEEPAAADSTPEATTPETPNTESPASEEGAATPESADPGEAATNTPDTSSETGASTPKADDEATGTTPEGDQ